MVLARRFCKTVTETLPQQIVPADGDTGHVEIILFTLFLGCTIGVMQASGGTRALVDSLTPLTRSRRGGQLTTWLLGLIIFFDDYANSLLVGSTMRPVTDRLRISREKLAFLVDATAAPIAGVAVISTWVGFEVGLIGDSLERLKKSSGELQMGTDGYTTLLSTLPYRFYPLLMIVFVAMLAWTGRDFASMRRAERRALDGDRESENAANPQAMDVSSAEQSDDRPGSIWNAIVPLIVLFGCLIVGFLWTGSRGVDDPDASLWQVVSNAESNKVMLASSFVASAGAVVLAVATRSLSFLDAVDAWIDGAKSMLLGCSVLVLAWAIASVCDADHLNTAGYLVDVTRGWLQPMWLPTVTFLLSGVIAFATGSSWATMGLVIPLVIEVTFSILTVGDATSASLGMSIDRNPLMLASIGDVLAGAIFGDHCSPISDTTVLSSIAADCDHIAHVTTQMPYAITVAVIAVVTGTLPAGLGAPWWLTLPLGLIACWMIVRHVGRTVEDDAGQSE